MVVFIWFVTYNTTYNTQEKYRVKELVKKREFLLVEGRCSFFVELWTQLLYRVVELYFVKVVVSWRGGLLLDR
uniref:Putative ovule protein n=1 Tax=Solanum chacoense TaxID=4108 RepID=A0A0V0HAW0_SOLCH